MQERVLTLAYCRTGEARSHAGTGHTDGRYVRANGLDIYYREAGQGRPLLLLHGGTYSTSDVWDDGPYGWGAHLDRFAKHFRVIAPDTRGHGRTVNPSGEMHFRLLAKDMVALIAALGLERPSVFGFSDGGHTATLIGMHNPGLLRAIVNFAGYDFFNPNAPSRRRIRAALGGHPDATHADPAILQRRSSSEGQRKQQADFDAAQGAGYWLTYYLQTFPMWAVPLAEGFADFRRITDPTLILVGDRDEYCSPEEAVTTYRMLPHAMTAQVTATALDFLLRNQ